MPDYASQMFLEIKGEREDEVELCNVPRVSTFEREQVTQARAHSINSPHSMLWAIYKKNGIAGLFSKILKAMGKAKFRFIQKLLPATFY